MRICVFYTSPKLGDIILHLPFIKAISEHFNSKVSNSSPETKSIAKSIVSLITSRLSFRRPFDIGCSTPGSAAVSQADPPFPSVDRKSGPIPIPTSFRNPRPGWRILTLSREMHLRLEATRRKAMPIRMGSWRPMTCSPHEAADAADGLNHDQGEVWSIWRSRPGPGLTKNLGILVRPDE